MEELFILQIHLYRVRQSQVFQNSFQTAHDIMFFLQVVKTISFFVERKKDIANEVQKVGTIYSCFVFFWKITNGYRSRAQTARCE